MRVAAAAGGMGGPVEQFRTDADADAAAVNATRARLDGIEPIPLLATYSAVEAKTVTAHDIRVRVQQLREKYTAAAEADGKVREHLRAATLAPGNRPSPRR